MNIFSFMTFFLSWLWLSKFELYNLRMQNCSIIKIYFISIINLTDCILIWHACIIMTIRIPTTILVIWEWPIQTNIISVYALIFCTCVTPIWEKMRFHCNVLKRNQNISEISTEHHIMSQTLDDHLTNVTKNWRKNKE